MMVRHMRARAVVEAQAFFQLPEVATDDVGEILELPRRLQGAGVGRRQ